MNKKGFTLVELLAVIVILAVIMVIATQQVNKAIKKSRGNAFYETVQSIRKSAQTVCAMDNTISTASLKENVDYSEDDISEIKVDSNDVGGPLSGAKVTVTINTEGKYANNTKPVVDDIYIVKPETGSTTSISFYADCK